MFQKLQFFKRPSVTLLEPTGRGRFVGYQIAGSRVSWPAKSDRYFWRPLMLYFFFGILSVLFISGCASKKSVEGPPLGREERFSDVRWVIFDPETTECAAKMPILYLSLLPAQYGSGFQFDWSGDCIDGYAQGSGQLMVKIPVHERYHHIVSFYGSFHQGYMQGLGAYIHFDGGGFVKIGNWNQSNEDGYLTTFISGGASAVEFHDCLDDRRNISMRTDIDVSTAEYNLADIKACIVPHSIVRTERWRNGKYICGDCFGDCEKQYVSKRSCLYTND